MEKMLKVISWVEVVLGVGYCGKFVIRRFLSICWRDNVSWSRTRCLKIY